uniref:Uncharacterized protein n=1 Tax=Oryza glumipatula TaxID=40148 RepID=A0A0E0B7R2_9ORYZ
MRASSPPHSAPDLFGATCSLPLISTSSRSLRAREADAAVGPVLAVSRARRAPPALVLKLLRAWVSLNGLSGWGPTKGRRAGRFAALLQSFDAVVNRLQAPLDATDAAAASLLRDHTALDDGNTRLGARLDRALASNLHQVLRKPTIKSFQWVQATIDFEGTNHGLSMSTRNH